MLELTAREYSVAQTEAIDRAYPEPLLYGLIPANLPEEGPTYLPWVKTVVTPIHGAELDYEYYFAIYAWQREWIPQPRRRIGPRLGVRLVVAGMEEEVRFKLQCNRQTLCWVQTLLEVGKFGIEDAAGKVFVVESWDRKLITEYLKWYEVWQQIVRGELSDYPPPQTDQKPPRKGRR